MDARCVSHDGHDTNFVSCKNEDHCIEMISERNHRIFTKCEEELQLPEKMSMESIYIQIKDKEDKCSIDKNMVAECNF